MMQFYDIYKNNEIVSILLTQISWSNNLAILSGTKTMEENSSINICDVNHIISSYKANHLTVL